MPNKGDITACGGGNTCDGLAGSYDTNANHVTDECEAQSRAASAVIPVKPVPDLDRGTGIQPQDDLDSRLRGSDEVVNGSYESIDSNATQTAPTTTANPDENPLADGRGSVQNVFDPGDRATSDYAPQTAPLTTANPLPHGRGSVNASRSGGPFDPDAAWLELFDWAITQCWGLNCSTSTAEQFQAYQNKRAELGLAP